LQRLREMKQRVEMRRRERGELIPSKSWQGLFNQKGQYNPYIEEGNREREREREREGNEEGSPYAIGWEWL
jgi:hypothetical protein